VRVNRKVLGGLMTACVVGSLFVAQPLGAAPDVSLQTWTCNGIPATIVGTPGGETLKGTPGADVIVAREGNDTIRGLGGDDIICAGKGNDIVYGGAGFDILYGAQGNDFLYAKNGATAFQRADNRGARMFGGADDDKIYGSNKWDRMQGGPGNDQLFGYEGRDWLRAGPGNDAVDGGASIDDQHGGNGRDDIQVTTGDLIRGGAGLDLCQLAGEPALLRSCGRNVRETPPQPGPVLNALTGHHYDVVAVSSGITWEDARVAAESRTFMGVNGHLTTIATAQEYDFLIARFPEAFPVRTHPFPVECQSPNFSTNSCNLPYWLGGFQLPTGAEPGGGWRWITGEPFSYTSWAAGEPNQFLGWEEDCLAPHPDVGSPDWADLACDRRSGGYFVEYPTPDL
jgi:hypothetical protein